jgi:hypothetical protein
MDGGLLAEGLVNRPVCFRDIRLGIVLDVIFDAPLERALGLDVLCGDRKRRFLAYGACEIDAGPVRVDSALVLMSEQLEFYRARGRSLTLLRGRPVRQGEAELGPLADVLIAGNGELVAFVLATDGRPVPLRAGVTIDPDALRRAV